jgi:hypothetical protein
MVESEQKVAPIKMNFSYIYKVNFNNNDPKLDDLTKEFNNLKIFEDGDSRHPGEGFKDFDDDFKIDVIVKPNAKYPESKDPDDQDSENVKKMRYEISISNNNILTKRFRYEKYFEGKKEAQIREGDIFWIKSCNVILIKGSLEACRKINDYLTKFTTAGFDKIDFEHDFLLWLVYKYQESEGKLSNDFEFMKIVRGRTQGTDSNENDISFRDCQSRMVPLTQIYGLLNDHEISHIGGFFKFRDEYKISLKIATDLSIHLYSDLILSGKSYLEKCNLAIPVILEIIYIFESWKKLSPKNKFPDETFFESMKQSFKEQIDDALQGFDSLNSRYAELRCENGVDNGS